MFCFLTAILLGQPHQTVAQQGDSWSDWTSYVYAVSDDGSARVTVASNVLVDEPTAEYLERRFNQNRESQLEVARDTIIAQEIVIAEKLGRTLSSSDLTLKGTRIGNLFVLETTWIWKGFAVRKGTSWIIDVLTVVPVTLDEKGSLTVVLPRSIDAITVSLAEDERQVQNDGIALIWKGPKQSVAPTIEYSTFWDRYQLWILFGVVLVAAGAGVGVYASRRRSTSRIRRRKARSTQAGPRVKEIRSTVGKPQVRSVQETGKRPRVLKVEEE
jgi:hypothetical protein